MGFSESLDIIIPFLPPSSRGLGHTVFIRATGIRIPLGVPFITKNKDPFKGSLFFVEGIQGI